MRTVITKLTAALSLVALVCALTFIMSPTANAAGNEVVLVVDSVIQPEIQPGLTRLSADLVAQGYTVKTLPTGGADAFGLWSYLKSEYTNFGLKGALLFGRIALATAYDNGPTTDLVYWNMSQAYRNVSNRNIWVGRFWGGSGSWDWPGYSWGDEATMINRALQANHDYRTGASRLPYNSYWSDPAYPGQYFGNMNLLTNIWPTVEFQYAGDAFLKGGECQNQMAHGGGDGYQGMSSHQIHHSIAQVRFMVGDNCDSGYIGGVHNQELLTRGGGAVLTIGASTTAYAGEFCMTDGSFGSASTLRTKLANGVSWGDALVATYPFAGNNYAMFYGDPSLKVKMAPANQKPVISSLTADVTSGVAPLTVNFSGTASDPDGTIVNCEWFHEGQWFGTVNPTASGAALLSTSYTYTKPGRYCVRLEVVDNYKARTWQEIEIDVAPTPGQSLRINCGTVATGNWGGWYEFDYFCGNNYTDSTSAVWLHDEQYAAGTWGWHVPSGVAARWQTEWNVAGGSAGRNGFSWNAVTGTNDSALYQQWRVDYDRTGFTYDFPLANGTYTVTLGFADLQNTAAGQRIMDVSANGAPWLTGFDIIATAGAPNAAVNVSKSISVTNGLLSLAFATNVSSPSCNWWGWAVVPNTHAIVNCIKIVPNGGGSGTPPAISSPLAASGTTGVPFSYTITASNSPTSFNATGLPTGLSVNTSSGVISGTPTAAGTSSIALSATNSSGTGTATLSLTVVAGAVAPTITSQPASQTVIEPATATFSVTANGSPAPTYQWQWAPPGSGFSVIAGATSATYTSGATSVALSGAQFRCVATNSAGSATSSAAILTINASSGGGGERVWVEDSIPAGGIAMSDGGDAWTWVGSAPSGSLCQQSSLAAGSHQHYFTDATQTLTVNAGDTLFTLVYLDPGNVPSEVMLQWNDNGSWEHRAYWGANALPWGTAGTTSLRNMGALPAAGQWVRLEVPASAVGLEGHTLTGMAFTLNDGRAWFDRAGATDVSTLNPIATWALNDGAGSTAADSSGNGHPGTVNGAAWTSGRVGNALSFNGATNLQVNNASILEIGKNGSDFSLGYWLYLQQGSTGLWRSIAHKGITDNDRTFGMWMYPDSNRIGYAISTAANFNEWGTSVAEITLNTWTYIAYVKSGNVVRLYLNGVLDSQINISSGATISNTGAIYFGKDPWFNGITGKLDEIALYARALSAGEVVALASVGGSTNHSPVITTAAAASPNPAVPGQTLTFSVAASDVDGDALSYAWNYGDSSSGSGASATHAYVSGGSYSAVATISDGQGGTVSSAVTVTVNAATAAPSITTQPVNKTVSAPATATFSVVASGSPAPTYQWQSAPSGSSTFTAISGANSASYTTGATSVGMNGSQYRCVASNSTGSATSTAAMLSVITDITPPVISAISARISGRNVTITWTTNEPSDSQVQYGTTIGYGSASALNTSMVTAHSVTLSNLDRKMTYHYRVLSRDASGNLATSNDATVGALGIDLSFTTEDVALGSGGGGGSSSGASGGGGGGCGMGSGIGLIIALLGFCRLRPTTRRWE